MNELISIIVPIYNTERFLDKCISSLVNQTYTHLEILAINNGSTDDSEKIVKRWANKDSRIRLISKEYGLAASARNMGLDLATGAYIMFVDSDDYVKSDYVEKLYKTIKENNVPIAQCCFYKVSGGKEIEYLPYYDDKIYTGRELSILQASFVGLSTPQTVLWNKIYHRSVFEKLRFREDREYEDMNVAHLLLYDKKEIAWISDRLYYWVIHEASHTTSSVYREQRVAEIWAYRDRIDYYHDIGDKELEWLNRKRCYYVATQHIYNMKHIHGNTEIIKELYQIIKEYYPLLKQNSSARMRSKLRWALIRLFPSVFGQISLHKKLDFEI